MPDSKITALTSISTSTDPANDPLVIVDVSDTSMAATGTTKKVTLNQLLATSPTATLASATISGDLTVDTSTLKVDSTNNRVIVGHTSGSAPFQVTNAGAAGLEIHPTGVSSAPLIISYNRSGLTYAQLTIDASTIVHAIGGTTAMTLNSTGLLVGMTNDLTGANISSSKGLGTANIATNKFATVEYGSGASGVFTTITVSFTVNSANSSVIIEALLSGFSGVYLDHVAGKYGTQVGVVIRNNASVGTTVAALAVDGTGLIYTLTITTAVTHPVIKVKATVGGQGQTTTLPVITFA